MSRSRHSAAPVHTITKFHEDPEPDVVVPRMRPWRKATIAVALAAAPVPVAATIANGGAGWTVVLLPAAALAVLGSAVSHAHAEEAMAEAEEPTVEFEWSDFKGTVIRYDAPSDRAEAA